jgi:superfamily II DNA or RNA helicase
MQHRSTITPPLRESIADAPTVPAYSLRPYQQQVIDRVWQLWSSRVAQKVLLQLPTGAGKTVVFAAIAQRFIERGAPVLVLAHREELLLQAKEKLESVTGGCVGLIKAGYREDRDALIQVASVASLLNRQLPPASLVIVDEAHHSTALTYTQLFEQFPDAAILGVTATPVRSDGRGFREIYDRLVVGPSVAWLIEQGYLSPYRLFAAPKTVDTTGVGKMGGDYNPRQLVKAVNTSLVMGDLIDAWTRYAHQKKTVVFAVNVEHSMAIAAAYRAHGIAAEHLDGSVKDADRKATLDRFRSGETLVLTNCGLFSEGFDVPSIEAVQCIRPTQSLALWLQILGRSLRPNPGKSEAIIIDHTENWIAHGLPDRPFAWSLDAIELDRDRWGVMCPHCRTTFRPDTTAQTPGSFEWCPQQLEFKAIAHYICPHCDQPMAMEHWQGTGEPPQPRVIETDREAEIWEIPTDCNVEILADLFRLVGFQRQVKRHVTLQWLTDRLLRSHPQLGFPELRECARLAGMDDQWAIDWAWQTVAQRWPDRLPTTPPITPPSHNLHSVPPTTEPETADHDAVQDTTGDRRRKSTPTPQSAIVPVPSIPPVSPHEIVRAIAARRQRAGFEDSTPPKLNARIHPIGDDDIINLEITDREPATPACPLPQLPPLRPRVRPRPAAHAAHAAAPIYGDHPHLTEHRLRGQLGTWSARVIIIPDPAIGCQTRIIYRAPNGRPFDEQIAGYHPQRYRQGIAELERRLRPAKSGRSRRARKARAVLEVPHNDFLKPRRA